MIVEPRSFGAVNGTVAILAANVTVPIVGASGAASNVVTVKVWVTVPTVITQLFAVLYAVPVVK